MGRQPLSTLAQKLSQYLGRSAPGYRRLWLAAVNGELPMLEQRSGRWYFYEADLAKIAAALALEKAADKLHEVA